MGAFDTDGSLEGERLGFELNVGDRLGALVGCCEMEGFSVGSLEGVDETEGFSEAVREGDTEGSCVGDTEDLAEGELLGLLLNDGADEGS